VAEIALPATPRSRLSPTTQRVLASTSIILATIMQTLDSTIANVALPHMQGTMSASLDQISWMLTSYMIATAIFTPLTGFLERRLGRARLFLLAVIFFTLASFLCGIAASLEQIVLFRLMQGAAGASIIPLCQSVMMDLFPPAKRGPAMALWGIGVMIGPIIGPTLGGYLTDEFSWRWVFFINVPIGIVSAIGIARFLPDTPIDRSSRFDWFGFTMLSLALGSLQLMLDRGQTLDWFESREVVIELLIAGAAFWMFAVHMFTSSSPFISPQIFRDINFVLGLCIMFLLGVVMIATMALLPTFLQNLLGYPVQTAGWLLAPRGLGTMMGMFLVGKLTEYIEPRHMVALGVLMLAGSLWQMSGFSFDTSRLEIIWSGLFQGIGMGFVFVPLSIVTFYTLQPRYRTEGASMFSLVRSIGGSIGLSVVIAYLTRATQSNHAHLVEHITPFSNAAEAMVGTVGLLGPENLPMIEREVMRQASMLAYIQDFEFMTIGTLCAIPLLLMLRPSRAK